MTLTSIEINSLIKGELINNPLYSNLCIGSTIKLAGISIESMELHGIYYRQKLHFINVNFIDKIIIDSCVFDDIEFEDCQFDDNSYFFIEKTIMKNLLFRGSSKIGGMRFISSTFQDVSFFGSTIKNVFIGEKSEFASFDFMWASVASHVSIFSGTFKQLSVASNQRVGVSSIPEIFILNADIDTFKLAGNTAIGKVTLRRGNYKQIIIKSAEVKEFITNRITIFKGEPPLIIEKIEFSGVGKLMFNVSELKIKSVIFDKYYAQKECTFNIIDLEIDELKFKNYINFGEFIFSRLIMKDGTAIEIDNSDLGKLTFLNSDIQNSNLTFNSSRITNIFVGGTEPPHQMNASRHELRSLYGQFKKVYENKGDAVTANVFYSKEMNAYNDTLKLCRNPGEKINIFLNKISTNHGQSWGRGLLSTLIACIGFYCIYLILLGFKLDFSSGSGAMLFNLWSYFFEFINPVHKTDYIIEALSKSKIPIKPNIAFARFCEGFARIPIAYFIYQLIQAFRKHGKK